MKKIAREKRARIEEKRYHRARQKQFLFDREKYTQRAKCYFTLSQINCQRRGGFERGPVVFVRTWLRSVILDRIRPSRKLRRKDEISPSTARCSHNGIYWKYIVSSSWNFIDVPFALRQSILVVCARVDIRVSLDISVVKSFACRTHFRIFWYQYGQSDLTNVYLTNLSNLLFEKKVSLHANRRCANEKDHLVIKKIRVWLFFLTLCWQWLGHWRESRLVFFVTF